MPETGKSNNGENTMPLSIAILASGSGTNAQALIDKAAAGLLDADIRLIAGNRPNAKVFDRARAAGIPHLALDHTAFESREAFDAAMVAAIRQSGAEYVVLAGYMRLLSSVFLSSPAFTVERTRWPTASSSQDVRCILWRKSWTAALSSFRRPSPSTPGKATTILWAASIRWNTAFIHRPSSGWPRDASASRAGRFT